MSVNQSVEERKNVENAESRNKQKSQREVQKTTISDKFLERALNGRTHNSAIKEIVEKVSKGPVLTKDNRAIETIDSNSAAVSRVIKDLNLKGKVKARSTEEGKSKPTMLWRVA